MAEAHFDFTRRQRFGAHHVVAHLIAAQQIAEILLVQRGERLRQVAGAGAAREMVVVVDIFLRQHQRHVRKAAGSGAPAMFARAAFEQIAQQRAAREQRQARRLPDRFGIEDVGDAAQDFVLDVDRHGHSPSKDGAPAALNASRGQRKNSKWLPPADRKLMGWPMMGKIARLVPHDSRKWPSTKAPPPHRAK